MKGYLTIRDSKGNIITEGHNHITKNLRNIIAEWFLNTIIKKDTTYTSALQMTKMVLSNNNIDSSSDLIYSDLFGEYSNETYQNCLVARLNQELTIADSANPGGNIVLEDNKVTFSYTFTNNGTPKTFRDVCIIGTTNGTTDNFLIARYNRGEFVLSDDETYSMIYELSF